VFACLYYLANRTTEALRGEWSLDPTTTSRHQIISTFSEVSLYASEHAPTGSKNILRSLRDLCHLPRIGNDQRQPLLDPACHQHTQARMAESSAPSNLPPRPSVSPSEREDNSPPRKRPRTRAPPQSTASSTRPLAEINTANTEMANTQTTSTTGAPPIQPSSQLYTFSIHPVHRFKGASTSIKRPREVAHFSYDDDHKYRADDSSINYYVPPPIGADLKEGFDTFRHHEDKEDAHLDSLLQALVDKERTDGEHARAKADFVTWRGMMTKVR
jgi:hypothetical protein